MTREKGFSGLLDGIDAFQVKTGCMVVLTEYQDLLMLRCYRPGESWPEITRCFDDPVEILDFLESIQSQSIR